MKSQLLQLAFEIWLITIQPKSETGDRAHDAFLKSYSPEDEGLYDDY